VDLSYYKVIDMGGNIVEWVEDDWHDNYKGALDDGTAWIDNPRGFFRVFRGGSWYGSAGGCRAAFRDRFVPDYRFNGLGFRLALLPGQS
jgi:formylglycine-generating enzyme required for sulfatase activity